MSGLADEMDSVGENNPRQMASVIRRLSEAAGELASAGKLDEAVIRYLQAVRLDPDRIEAYTLLADAYAAKDREALSEGVLQGAPQAHADNVKLLLALGRLHVSWKHPAKVQPLYEKAAKELAEASREAPHAAAPREFLAAILTRRGKADQAEQLLREFAASEAKDAEAQLCLAARALELDARSPSALDTFGWICTKRQESEEAAGAFRRSLAARPESATTRYHLAVVLQATGKPGEARQELERALAAKGAFPEAEEAKALLARLKP
jgi:tetratricopeptide (TPR) repeat protein